MVSFKNILAVSLASSITVQGLSIIPGLEPYFDKAMSVLNLKQSENIVGEVIQTFPGADDKPVPGDSPIIQCEASVPQLLALQKVIISPNPPARGQNLTFIATGFLKEDVTEGAYVEVEVRYGFIKLIHQTFDLCEEITKVDMECPINKGEQVIKKEVEIPDEVPPGKYSVIARAYTAEDKFITCLTANIEFPAAL